MSKRGHAVVVSTIIERSPAEVWADVRDIESHVSWMQDAAAIRFLSEQREGQGTRFECDTKVGPFSLTDIMEITSWEDERRMGVRHVGLVEGTGEFTLIELGPDRTEFRWEEDLVFPWFLGGPVGAFFARPVLRWVWKGNLKRLTARIEAV
ncbi:MAG TPA: SRPBCC family protein [Ilumatobacter sp.]|nr:SRPBCC family protein [Ilumatobacter sp.]